MTKRIFRAIISVAILILISSFILIMGVMFGYFGSLQENQLKTELQLATHSVEREGTGYLKKIKSGNERFTYISSNGKVLYDSVASTDRMGNHSNREEFKNALKNGMGKSTRYSETMTEKTIYYAARLSNGDVLRVSVSRVTAIPLILGMMQPILLVLLIAFLLSLFIARRMADKIIRPLNEIDLDCPLENDIYEELSPLLLHIESQKAKLKSQEKMLIEKKSEFSHVIENMEEGLVLLDKDDNVISMNRAANTFFDIENNCKGKNFIYLERNMEINKFIDDVRCRGKGEMQKVKCGSVYQLNAGRISDGTGKFGIVLLIVDITEKYFAERNRREFTANVSHELKTPIHSIMGSAELIEAGLIKGEELPEFAKRILEDASRLNFIVEDIMELSKLEESNYFEEEEIDIIEFLREEVKLLEGVSKMRDVDVLISGKSIRYRTSRKLLHQCMYNLIENGIKYNSSPGKLHINLLEDNGKVLIEVEDTGIGIEKEHLSRIFERFYRVDKGRTKELGGTGLGLSIVKHSAEKLGGKILVESKFGFGTKFTLVL